MRDVRVTFRVASYNGHAGEDLDGLDELLQELNFRYISLVDAENDLIR